MLIFFCDLICSITKVFSLCLNASRATKNLDSAYRCGKGGAAATIDSRLPLPLKQHALMQSV
jgi:hypothetical protein